MQNERERLIHEILAQQEGPEEPWSPRQPGCPPIAVLMDVLLERADPTLAEGVNAHCAGCADCGYRLTVFRAALRDEVETEPPYEGSLLEVVARSKDDIDAEETDQGDDDQAHARTEVKPIVSNETAVTLPNPVRSGDYEAFHQRLAPLVPGLLWSAGLEPTLAAEFLDYAKERVADFKGRHVSDALPVWLAEFARLQATSAQLDPEFDLAESIAVHQVLAREEPGQPDWARALRRTAMEQKVRSTNQLRQLPTPDKASTLFLRSVCDEIDRAVRITTGVLQETV